MGAWWIIWGAALSACGSGAVKFDTEDSGPGEPPPDGAEVTAEASYDADASLLLHCEPLYLSGAASSGEAPLAYTWDLLSTPPGSARSASDILEVTDAEPTFTPDIAGRYAFGLTVTDASGAVSERAELDAEIGERSNNAAPEVDPGEDQTHTEAVECVPGGYGLDCESCEPQAFAVLGEVSDADDDSLSYSWSVVAGDPGVVIEDPSSLETTVTLRGPDGAAGQTTTNAVVLQLSATDCFGETSTAEVTLSIDCVAE